MISDRPEKPLASWRGKERYGNEILECLTLIFRSGGCSWSACRMCSYRHERYQAESCAALLAYLRAQLAWVRTEYDPADYGMVKIFTSGSFFDPKEVPPAFLADVAGAFRGKLVLAESRPEFVREETVGPFIEALDDGSWRVPLYCAIGLETSNDTIREKCINKGFTFEDFRAASRRAHNAGAGVKAYLLFKPLFLTEAEAVADMKQSFTDAVPCAEMFSMNPCTVQRNTELEYYWKRGAYRPPYLWSVLTLLAAAPFHVTCDPLGGGRNAGRTTAGPATMRSSKGSGIIRSITIATSSAPCSILTAGAGRNGNSCALKKNRIVCR
jgi:hypothetical protein